MEESPAWRSTRSSVVARPKAGKANRKPPAKNAGKPTSKEPVTAKAEGKVSKWKKCQICGKTDHTADKCYQRFKHKDGRTSEVQDALSSSGARKTT